MRISTAGIALKDGKYMMALRNPGTSIGESWEFPGGKLEEGETPPEGLMREYKEEFNLDIKVGKQIHESIFSNKGNDYRLIAFLVEISGGPMLHPEHQEVRWVSISEMQDLPMAASDKAIVKTLTLSSSNNRT